MAKGCVYILTNPAFKDDWVKIGMTSRDVDVRSAELDNTAVPLPYEVYATLKTELYQKAEKHIHEMIDKLTDLRVRDNREFFKITPVEAYDIFKSVSCLLPDAELALHQKDVQDKPDNSKHAKKSKAIRTEFGKLGVPIGAVLTPRGLGKVSPKTDIVVHDSVNTVEYDGKTYSISACAVKLVEEAGSPGKSYNGFDHFKYNGKILFKIRRELESKGLYK